MRLTPAYLHARLRYEPSTGKLYWRKHASMSVQWNGRYAGKEAFTTSHPNKGRMGCLAGRTMWAHRIIWAMVTGKWPDEIDHEDHDRSNNCMRNLRKASRAQNARNLPKRKDGTLVTGVRWHQRGKVWEARIRVDTVLVYLGSYKNFDDAVEARRQAEVKHGFHVNHGK